MRVEQMYGRYLLCGGIIDKDQVKVGQVWAAADGTNRTVTVESTRGDWIEYSWIEKDVKKTNEKMNVTFQCRYCLVLPDQHIPEELK